MKSKKDKYKLIKEGAASAFDLLGSGFHKKTNENIINESWYNVGIYFSTGFSNPELKNRKNDCDKFNDKLEFH